MRLIILSLCTLFPLTVTAQRVESDFDGYLAYAETAGLAGFYSINIEHVLFRAGSYYGGVRVGYGQVRFNQGSVLFRGVPLALQFFRHYGNHHSDFGLGISYISGMQYSTGAIFFWPDYSEAIYGGPMLGYRYQKPDGGIFIRVQYIPLIKVRELTNDAFFKSYEGKLVHSPGIAVGYYFRSRNAKRDQ